MSFDPFYRAEIQRRHPDDIDRVSLEYLYARRDLDQIRVPLDQICEYLSKRFNRKIPVKEFQQGTLKRSREGNWPIGSDPKGICLMLTEKDFRDTDAFSQKRQRKQRKIQLHIRHLGAQFGWTVPTIARTGDLFAETIPCPHCGAQVICPRCG